MVNYHLILIPTMHRTGRLQKVITDILGNIEKYNFPRSMIEIIIVDDSKEESFLQNNRKMLEYMKRKTGIKIKYFGRENQIEFLHDIKEWGTVDPENYIYINKAENKKGYGGIRNLLCMVAIYNTHHPNTIISFFDDDTSLKNLCSDNGRLHLDHAFSFFHRMDYIFSNPIVNILGGDYTRDLFQGYWITSHLLLVLDKFFELAKNKNPNESSEEIKNQVLTIQNPWCKKIDVSLVSADYPISFALKLLAGEERGFIGLVQQVQRWGAYRLLPFPYKDADKTYFWPFDWLVGGNVSIRYNALVGGVPYPLNTWRGEDVTWSRMMERFIGGVYQANMPVGHLRDFEGRGDLFREYALDTACHFADIIIENLVKRRDKRETIVEDMKNNITPEIHGWINNAYEGLFSGYCGLNDWRYMPDRIKEKLHDNNAWWSQHKYGGYVKRIDEFLDFLKNSDVKAEINKRIPSTETIEKSVHIYADLIRDWPELVNTIIVMRGKIGKDYGVLAVQPETGEEWLKDDYGELDNFFDEIVEEEYDELDRELEAVL